MGHYGKHVIDPETGLCEICDKNAIQEVRQGRRLDGQDRYATERKAGSTGSYIRKSSNPPPQARPRRVIYENTHQAPNPTRRIVRHESTPTREVIVHRPSPRPPTVVYVDNENRRIPQYHTPTPVRPVQVIHQRALTPPPPASEIWYSGPMRQTNSGIGYIQQQPVVIHDQGYYPQILPRNPGAQYVEVFPNVAHHPPLNSFMPVSSVYRPYPIEIIEPRIYNEPEPNVVTRAYTKFPPGRYEPMTNTTFVNPQPLRGPPVYHIRTGVNN